MIVEGLQIPELLDALLDAGKWPRAADEASKQNSRSLIPEDRNRRLRKIYLYPPPFQTVARAVSGRGRNFYIRFGALHELVPEAAIEIADFGLGADAPILLDYRQSPKDPTVIYLEWPGDGRPNYWVEMARDFASFVEALGL
jgi:hypothetical protein